MDRNAFLRAVSISSDAVGNQRWHEAVTAASDLIEAGDLTEETAASIVLRTLMEQPPLVLAALRVAARPEPRFKDTGREWVVGLIEVARGRYFDADAPDAAAVVVEFILRATTSAKGTAPTQGPESPGDGRGSPISALTGWCASGRATWTSSSPTCTSGAC